MISTSRFQPVNPTIRAQVYDHFKVDSSDVKRDIGIIQEWMKQQPHLPEKVEDDFIEYWLVINKFRVEPTKERLERYYSLKSINAEEVAKIRSALPAQAIQMILPLPLLNEKLERIIIVKIKKQNIVSEEDILKFFKFSLCLNEYSLRQEYCLGHRVIQDYEGLTDEHVKKFMMTLSQLARPSWGAYFIRLAGLECLNVSSIVETIFKGMKYTMSKKIYSRIAVHKNLESLHKNINKAYLPPEYGGDLKTSIPELLDNWNKEFEGRVDTLEKMVVSDISDETKRVGKIKYNELFGVDGTFKKLSVD